MNTPIADFLEDYEKKGMLRLHMPGHNGEAPHDITEIAGADSLYETDSSRGIIAHSEAIAAKLFWRGTHLLLRRRKHPRYPGGSCHSQGAGLQDHRRRALLPP